MPSKKFELPKTQEEAQRQLQGFFERAVKAQAKYDLFCESVGMPSKDFWNNNFNTLTNSPAFIQWVNAVRNTFGLEVNEVVKDNVKLDFGGYTLNVHPEKGKK